VLAAVSNLSRNQADVELRFELKNLGLPDQVTAEDAREGTPLKMVGNKLSVRLEPQGWMLICLQRGGGPAVRPTAD
jgi:hypothetical protein